MKKIAYISDFKKWEKEFEFSCPIQVRFNETDMYGHVNNTVPFTYFEYARIEYLKYLGFMEYWNDPDNETIPVVADLQCDFLAQMYFDDRIHVYVKVNEIGRSSVDLHYMGKKGDGTLCFTGRGRIVQVNRQTGRPEPWKQGMKDMLLKQFESEGEPTFKS
ncbi:acyl-CoA thioesterase [Fervidibacillus halotolerans]|uniref:Acyl-CoA thioesterase n=1 Tax=Fervidibacillus halotolerans TaxID=2980027 RepID=A0A9E8LXZ1_9BACI|nr:thioesterase family protein [Fervidibacillus halotolerans]WAA11614.1 acyl-CoA thioesterase [Fervidibacillus halotolerans]